MELKDLKTGTVLVKGDRKRIFLFSHWDWVFYNSPTSPETKSVLKTTFKGWLKGATVVDS